MFFTLFRQAAPAPGWDGRHLLAAEVLLGSCISSQPDLYRSLKQPEALKAQLLADFTMLLQHAGQVTYLSDPEVSATLAEGIEAFVEEEAADLVESIAGAETLDAVPIPEMLMASMRDDELFAAYCRRAGGYTT